MAVKGQGRPKKGTVKKTAPKIIVDEECESPHVIPGETVESQALDAQSTTKVEATRYANASQVVKREDIERILVEFRNMVTHIKTIAEFLEDFIKLGTTQK